MMEMTHFAETGAARTACGLWVQNGTLTLVTREWTQVDCGGCRLEQPMVKWEAPEYRMPSQQQEFLTSLADFSAAQREVAALRSLLEAAESRLSAIVSAQKGLAGGADAGLSDAARTALLAVPSDAEGAYVRAESVHDELRLADLIGPRGGLTRKGSILKAQLDREQLDALFGEE